MEPVTIYFMRHGETIFNALGRVQGWCDTPLTEKGVKQAQMLGEKLKNICFKIAFTSDSLRTRASAKEILESNINGQIVNEELPELREWFYGGFEGKTDFEMWASIFESAGLDFNNAEKDYEILTSIYSDKEINSLLSIRDNLHLLEPYESIKERANKAIKIILKKTRELGGGNALVVSSGSFIPTMLVQMGVDRKISGINLSNCDVVKVTIDDNVTDCEIL